jgi:hypothetical protein
MTWRQRRTGSLCLAAIGVIPRCAPTSLKVFCGTVERGSAFGLHHRYTANTLPKLATEPFLKLWEQEVFALLVGTSMP